MIERLWLLPVTNEWTLQLITFPLLPSSVQQNAKRRHGGRRHFVHHFLHVFLSMCLLLSSIETILIASSAIAGVPDALNALDNLDIELGDQSTRQISSLERVTNIMTTRTEPMSDP